MKVNLLRESRRKLGLTQEEAAKRLGVSQTYLSMLENERRKLTDALARKAVARLSVSPSALPLNGELRSVGAVTNDELAKDLAFLRYPGFSHVRTTRKKNPAHVLLAALRTDNLEARLTEALPWLLLHFSDLQWDRLVEAAKVNDLQNRLGFLTAMARKLAEKQGDREKEKVFARREQDLFPSKLAKQDTLCRESMTDSERKWLRQHRLPEAKRWNVLSDLNVDQLSYA